MQVKALACSLSVTAQQNPYIHINTTALEQTVTVTKWQVDELKYKALYSRL